MPNQPIKLNLAPPAPDVRHYINPIDEFLYKRLPYEDMIILSAFKFTNVPAPAKPILRSATFELEEAVTLALIYLSGESGAIQKFRIEYDTLSPTAPRKSINELCPQLAVEMKTANRMAIILTKNPGSEPYQFSIAHLFIIVDTHNAQRRMSPPHQGNPI